jgi:uncharacterized membrane protein
MTEALRQFIETYYIHPITHDTGYNPINTITWALVLVVCLFLTFRLLKRLKIDMNYRFIAAVVPYIVVGARCRVALTAPELPPDYATNILCRVLLLPRPALSVSDRNTIGAIESV